MSGTLSTTPNPMIAQGTLNRVRGSVVIPNYPQLNVTASYLGKGGILFRPEGEVTDNIGTMTGSVTSPVPYLMCSVIVNLLRTQSLAAAYKLQMETLSLLGAVNVIPDASTLPNWNCYNMSIAEVAEMNFSGVDPGYMVTLKGYIIINSSLFGLT